MLNTNHTFRLIISNKQSACLNMATDEALVNSFKENDMPILRLYSWEKSFTLGVSQNISDYTHLKEYKNNCAKRITGGGVLFHGHDLSYCLILPHTTMKDLNVKQSYEKICSFLLEFYNNLGLHAIYAKDDVSTQLFKSEFCQVGFEAYDILINGIKLGGNAQRRTKKLIFQHGSIPLEKTMDENKTKQNLEIGHSLAEFDINLSYSKAQELLINAFEKTFAVQLEKSFLNEKEKENLSLLLKDKYDYAK